MLLLLCRFNGLYSAIELPLSCQSTVYTSAYLHYPAPRHSRQHSRFTVNAKLDFPVRSTDAKIFHTIFWTKCIFLPGNECSSPKMGTATLHRPWPVERLAASFWSFRCFRPKYVVPNRSCVQRTPAKHPKENDWRNNASPRKSHEAHGTEVSTLSEDMLSTKHVAVATTTYRDTVVRRFVQLSWKIRSQGTAEGAWASSRDAGSSDPRNSSTVWMLTEGISKPPC